jgi:hypothetical protein
MSEDTEVNKSAPNSPENTEEVEGIHSALGDEERIERFRNFYAPAALIAGVFWVLTHWGFWTRGIYALGINTSVFCLGLLFLVCRESDTSKVDWRSSIEWLFPLLLLAISFSLYENPFFKLIAIFVFPTILLFYKTLWMTDDHPRSSWSFQYVLRIWLLGSSGAFQWFGVSTYQLRQFCVEKMRIEVRLAGRILLGVTCFALLAAIVIPLLMAADGVFGERIQLVLNHIETFISISFVLKIIVALLIATLVLSFAILWAGKLSVPGKSEVSSLDSLVAGIVVGGLLAVYLLFLSVQLERLFVSDLPLEFLETESLVKSGFWQLFFVSAINVGLFVFMYRKTNQTVDYLLRTFASASLLILASAAQRMLMYVYYYGFSYEKFYALYTVLYCAILLWVLVVVAFSTKRHEPIRIGFGLLIWMFGLVSVFPTERFILEANLLLAEQPGTRVRLSEMQMLSTDVMSVVADYRKDGVIPESREVESFVTMRNGRRLPTYRNGWEYWTHKRKKDLQKKSFYEYTIMNILHVLSRVE